MGGELGKLDALRVQSVGGAPYIRGKTALNDLLAAGSVAAPVQTAFVQSYADNDGQLAPVWQALRANKSFSAADLDHLETTLSAGALLSGNVPLITYTLGRLASPQGSIKHVRDLARLNQSDWEALIKQVDPTGQSVPSVLPTDTLDQRVARLAQALSNRFASRYKTVALAGGFAKASASAFKTRTELVTFLEANPSLDITRMNIDVFIANPNNKVTPPRRPPSPSSRWRSACSASRRTTLRSRRWRRPVTGRRRASTSGTRRVHRPDDWAARQRFLASAAFTRAEATYAAALTAFGRFNARMNPIPACHSSLPRRRLRVRCRASRTLPNLQSLFGSLDYRECADCRSVLSPAAYLVDLLQLLKRITVTGTTTVLDILLRRRPDLQFIALDCNNTNTTLPYIDLVNELLEASVAQAGAPAYPLIHRHDRDVC